MFRPSELNAFLKENNFKAQKRLSQNFLIDGNIIRKIIAESKLLKDDLVLEIGPGPGALTSLLLEAGARVIAIEKDRGFASTLSRLDKSGSRLTVIEADFFKCDLKKILEDKLLPGQKAKVIANLPYHITTPVITELITKNDLFSSLTVMVQKEVALRFIASPNTSAYGSITIFLKYFSNSKRCFDISPNCFYPKPKVVSSLVHFELLEREFTPKMVEFFKFVQKTFQQRRKMLTTSLKETASQEQIQAALLKMGLSPKSRPENLSLENFLELFASTGFGGKENS